MSKLLTASARGLHLLNGSSLQLPSYSTRAELLTHLHAAICGLWIELPKRQGLLRLVRISLLRSRKFANGEIQLEISEPRPERP